MKILITGGCGFIASNLVKKLIKENEIFIIDNFDRKPNDLISTKTVDITNKSEVMKNFLDKFPIIFNVDIVNYYDVLKIINEVKPDIIIHMAALCGVDNVIKRPVKTMEVNTIGSYNILKSIVESNIKIKKIISTSTSEVYGNYSYKLDENECTTLGAVGEARWSYSVSKLASEHLCFAFNKEYNLPFISIRPFNIYGPGQIGEGAIQIFIKNCLNNEDLLIHGDGSQIRSWCYVDDAIDFISRCIYNDNAIGNVFNMGNPEGTITTIGLARKIKDLTKSKSKIKFIENPNVDIELRIPNIEKAKNILNYEPKVGLDEGIIKTYEWYQERKNG